MPLKCMDSKELKANWSCLSLYFRATPQKHFISRDVGWSPLWAVFGPLLILFDKIADKDERWLHLLWEHLQLWPCNYGPASMKWVDSESLVVAINRRQPEAHAQIVFEHRTMCGSKFPVLEMFLLPCQD
eukprot:449416-Pelagomonas_calceolata.AAC.2